MSRQLQVQGVYTAETLLSYIQSGLALERQGRLQEAQTCYEVGLSHFPGSAELYNNLGNVFKRGGKPEQALRAYQKAIQLNSTLAEPYNNMGMLLQMQGKAASAIEYFTQSLKANPRYSVARLNRAMSRLLLGEYELGWTDYEARRDASDFPKWNPLKSFQADQPVSGKTLLVYSEQGFGDTFQFIRYLPLLKAQGAKVILSVQPGLASLLQAYPGVDKLIEANSESACEVSYDAHIPLLSLPAHFQTRKDSIPTTVPYLQANPSLVQRWRERFRSTDLNIGVVWSGNPLHMHNAQRSCPLGLFSGLSRISYTKYFSLQMGPMQLKNNKDSHYWSNLVDLASEIHSFSDTAAIIAHLDLVITVDTAVAHLAGAMGKPVWLALCAVPDWRWLLETTKSAWYPTMQLFRQKQSGDWESVIDEMANQLKHLDKKSFTLF